MSGSSNKFVFDRLLEPDEICNLLRERELLLAGVEKSKKLVVFGPRNYGKTSLIQHIVVREFLKKNPGSFVLSVDLLEVKSLDAISIRVEKAFSLAFAKAYPARALAEAARKLISGFRPKIEIDPVSTLPTITFDSKSSEKPIPFQEIFEVIIEKIIPKKKVLIVLDEFQDVAFVDEAQGLLRASFQKIRNTPIILLGSKQHLLSKIFAQPSAPLAGFGEDIEFRCIPYVEYHEYIMARFKAHKIEMTLEVSTFLQNLMFRIPESINILCTQICDLFPRQKITEARVHEAVSSVLTRRQSRFESYLAHFSENDEKILTALAKAENVSKPTGKDFMKKLSVTPRSVSLAFLYFLDHFVVERRKEGYRVADPLLQYYLQMFR